MSGRRKLLLIGSFLIIDILLFVCIVIVCSATIRNSLEKEVNSLVNLDITEDRYNTSIKNSGNYGKVEEAIKCYLDEYALKVQDVLSSVDYKKLASFINYENYLTDEVSISADLLYLDGLKESFNKEIDLLIDEDNDVVYNYVYNYIDDVYFVKLYNNLIDEKIIGVINSNRNYLSFKKVEVNSYIDSIYNLVNFVNINSNSYILVDGKIQFNSDDLEIEYFKLIDRIKESKI